MPKRGQYKKNAKKRSVYQRKYNSRRLQKKRRNKRNVARRRAIRAGKVKKGSKKDVHHKKRNVRGNLNNSSSNLAIVGRSANRANNSQGRKKRK